MTEADIDGEALNVDGRSSTLSLAVTDASALRFLEKKSLAWRAVGAAVDGLLAVGDDGKELRERKVELRERPPRGERVRILLVGVE